MAILWIIAIILSFFTYGISILVALVITFFIYNGKQDDVGEYLLGQYDRYYSTVKGSKNHFWINHANDSEGRIELKKLLNYTYSVAYTHYIYDKSIVGNDQYLRMVLNITFSTVYTYCNVFGLENWKIYEVDKYIKDQISLLNLAAKKYGMEDNIHQDDIDMLLNKIMK